MCCDCTHPEALRATGNEKEQVVCVPLAGHIPVCHTLLPPLGTGARGAPGASHPARAPPQAAPAPDACRGSSWAGSNIPWPSSELCSNSMALLCQLALFPHLKLIFLVNGVALTAPCSRAPAPCPCGRQHKGALWGQELAQHSSKCSSRALAKHKGQNLCSFDRRKTILFVGETSN